MNLKIHIAQTKPVPGNLQYNCDNILSGINQAKEAKSDLIVFSYGSLTGTNMGDLMISKQFIESVQKYNAIITAAATDIHVILPTILSDGEAAVHYFNDEETIHLATMDINEEEFEKLLINDSSIAINPIIPNADLNIFLAAPLFCKEIDFESKMHQMLADTDNTILFVNAAGFSNGAVFSGASFGICNNHIFYRDKSFESSLTQIDLSKPENALRHPKLSNIENTYNAIIMSIKSFVNDTGFPGAALGMSGGIDSAVVGALAVKALGAEKVRCLIMPSEYSGKDTMADAEVICNRLGIQYDITPIKSILDSFKASLEKVFSGNLKGITEENIQARIRGILNMALSNNQGYAILVTGNKSELSVGYSTLYGDTAGALAPIMDLYKHEVYELAEFINNLGDGELIPKSIIERAPSAELRPDQKDSDSLPEYDILDALLYNFIEEDSTIEKAAKAAGTDIDTAKKIYSLLSRAEFKRRQYPLGIMISRSSFGNHEYWDFPITNKYKP